MAVLSRQKQPNLSRGFGFPIIPQSAAEPSHFFNKLQFYQCQAQWPFYQSRSNQMARPLDFSHKLQFRYYPAQSTYQRPGKPFLAKASPMAVVYHMAALSRQKQLNCKTPRFEPWIANSHNPTQKVYQWQGRASFNEKRPRCRFAKGRPSCQTPMPI